MLVLLMASLIAVSSVSISTQETKIAANEKAATIVFFQADAGIAPGIQVLLDSIVNKSVASYPALTWTPESLNGGQNIFLDEVMGVSTSDNRGFNFSTPNNGGITTSVRMKRNMATTKSTGGSTEFGSGYEGVGYGSAGGVIIYYFVRSSASDPNGSRSSLETEYRKVIRVGGGK